MTEEPSGREPADGEEIADSLDIDEAAGQTRPPDQQADPVSSDEPGAGTEKFEPPFPAAAAPVDDPDAADGKPGKRTKKPHRKAPWWELPALIALAILIAILVKTFLVQPFYIPSESMEKTLHGCTGCSGDRILVNKLIYDFRDPHPGDIVVFNAPPGWNDEPPSQPPGNPIVRAVRGFGQLIGFVPPDGLVLVKRVIAVGGQTVKGDAQGHVFISQHGPGGPWRQLDETYVYESGPDDKAKFGPITVPKGRLWVMGDHRNASADSRYHCGPNGSDGPDDASCDVASATVPISDVIGKAFVIAWPPSRWTTLGTPKTFTNASAGLAGAGVLPLGLVAPLYLVRRRRRRR
jgi:signal peptidase I